MKNKHNNTPKDNKHNKVSRRQLFTVTSFKLKTSNLDFMQLKHV